MPGLLPGIHVFLVVKDVDGRAKPGHDDLLRLAEFAVPRRRRLLRGAFPGSYL